MFNTPLKASVIDVNGYFGRYSSCIKILIDFNSSMGFSFIFFSIFYVRPNRILELFIVETPDDCIWLAEVLLDYMLRLI